MSCTKIICPYLFLNEVAAATPVFFFFTVVILFFGNAALQFASSHCSYDAPIATCCDTGIRYWAIFYKFAGLSDVGLRGWGWGGGKSARNMPVLNKFPGEFFSLPLDRTWHLERSVRRICLWQPQIRVAQREQGGIETESGSCLFKCHFHEVNL